MFMAFGNWLTETPLYIVFLVLCAGLIGCAMLGIQLRRRRIAKGASEEKLDQEGYVVSAVMGLLALLIGFTFSLAIDRFDTRRQAVLQEANAIGTTYLRAQLLEEPHRDRITRLLVDYTGNRIVLGKASDTSDRRAMLARNNQLITDLWTATVAAFPSIKPYAFSNSFLDTMNNLIDMDASRKTARRAHVPPQVFFVLFTYQFITAGVLGYVMAGSKGRRTAAMLMFLFALAQVLVIDIDRPVTGTVRESQEPIELLYADMRGQPPEVFDRFNEPAAEPAR